MQALAVKNARIDKASKYTIKIQPKKEVAAYKGESPFFIVIID